MSAPLSPIFSDCPSLASGYASSNESGKLSDISQAKLSTDGCSTVLSLAIDSPNYLFSFDSPSPPRIEFDYDDPDGAYEPTSHGRMTEPISADYMYPSYDPFEEGLEFDCKTYDDVEEALAVIDRKSQRKRYMVGLFPGVNESFLQRDSIRESPLPATLYNACDVWV